MSIKTTMVLNAWPNFWRQILQSWTWIGSIWIGLDWIGWD